jgi:hypothetical protein
MAPGGGRCWSSDEAGGQSWAPERVQAVVRESREAERDMQREKGRLGALVF